MIWVQQRLTSYLYLAIRSHSMVRLIVCMTVYQHISLFQNSPIYQLLIVHCSNVHVSNLRNVCDYNDYTLTNVLVLDTTLKAI